MMWRSLTRDHSASTEVSQSPEEPREVSTSEREFRDTALVSRLSTLVSCASLKSWEFTDKLSSLLFWVLELVFWVLELVFWVLPLVFWVLPLVFCVLPLVFWVLPLVFWVLPLEFWVLSSTLKFLESSSLRDSPSSLSFGSNASAWRW